MNNRTHILLAIALLIALAVLGSIMRNQIPPRIDLPFDLQSTALAAEFATTPEEINATFGSEQRYAKDIIAQQYWDFAFIPCYVALFVVLGLALRRYDIPTPGALAWSAAALAIAAGVLDVAENITIISVANNPNAFSSHVRWFSLPKWGMVFAVLIIESAVFLFWPRLKLAWRLAAIATGGALLFAGAAGLIVTLLVSIREIAAAAEWMTWALTMALLFLVAAVVPRRAAR